jgi:hypothetical protein
MTNVLEKLVVVKIAIDNNKPKEEVDKKYNEYLTFYEELGGEQTISDKIRNRELLFKYINYIGKLGRNNKK